eukprot:4184098-Karenia_brevis.AAC.1
MASNHAQGKLLARHALVHHNRNRQSLRPGYHGYAVAPCMANCHILLYGRPQMHDERSAEAEHLLVVSD